jgi:catechol 2,3-dioxygenase-like lactoylglutathione lyase family enzyme
VARFHHVNLGVPLDGIDAETEWLVDVLGMARVPPPQGLEGRELWWFESDGGWQVHLSRDEEHRPARMAHVAVEVDDVEGIRTRIEARSEKYSMGGLAGLTVLNCKDPSGNRWEIREPAA